MALKRNRWTYSFRTVFIVFACIAVLVSIFLADYQRARQVYERESLALSELEKLDSSFQREWRGPLWWRCVPYHREFKVFERVVAVRVGGSAWSMSGHYSDEQLKVIEKFKFVEKAHVTSYSMTKQGFLRLATLQNLQQLRVDSFAMPPSVQEKLQAQLPECKISVNLAMQ